MTNRMIALALAALLGSAGVAMAQTSSTMQPPEPRGTTLGQQADQNDPAKPFSALEMEKITAALTSHGYTSPTNLRRDGDSFLVTAMKGSALQEVRVDPQSGVVKSVDMTKQ
jgi:hypothetical protein